MGFTWEVDAQRYWKRACVLDTHFGNSDTPRRGLRRSDLMRRGARMGICDGRVVVITGGGRGLGRAHALAFAAEGATVVVNDLGADARRRGHRPRPAQEVVDEIEAAGGEAIVNGDDVSDWDGAGRLVEQAIDTFGGLDTVVCNAGIVRDRMIVNMSVDEWDAVIRVHLRGMFCPVRHAIDYWRAQSQGRHARRGPHRHHLVGRRPVRQRVAGQLRRGQGRHRRVHDHRRRRARPLRHPRQRHRPVGAQPDDRGRVRRDDAQARVGLRRDGPGQRRRRSSCGSARRTAT